MSKDNFQWTDELVRGFIGRAFAPCDPNHPFFDSRMADFKQSHTQAELEKDWRIMQFINKKGNHTWDYDGLNNDYVGSGHGARFSEEALLDSRDGRSSVANGDILINKVIRKSDLQVFSVGDEVEWEHCSPFKVAEFCIYKGAMFANEKSGCYGIDIKYARKSIHTKERIEVTVSKNRGISPNRPIGEYSLRSSEEIPQEKFPAIKEAIERVLNDDAVSDAQSDAAKPKQDVLFVTSDGVKVHLGDKFWYVNVLFQKHKLSADEKMAWARQLMPSEKIFSTEEKAQEYITQNKPLNLSMKEIASCITNFVVAGTFPQQGTTVIDWRKLDELIKQKTSI